MKSNFIGFFSLLILFSFFMTTTVSCYKDNEEELYPAGCDTTEVLYSVHVEPLIQNFCYACHGSTVFSSLGGNLELESYDKFIIPINSGSLLNAIKHEQGISPMPQNSTKLGDCSINTIEAWVNQGALNN